MTFAPRSRNLCAAMAFFEATIILRINLCLAAPADTTAPIARSESASTPSTRPSRVMQLTVVDPLTGKPIPEAKIEFDGEPQNGHAVTNAQGIAMIDFTSYLHPWLTAQASGHVDKMVNWVRDRQKDLQPPAAYTVSLEAATTLGGMVLDDASHPVEGANVVVEVRNDTPRDSVEQNWFSFQSTKSKADGSWGFEGVPTHYKSIDVGVWDFRYVINEGGEGFYNLNAYPQVEELLNHRATLRLSKGVTLSGVILGPNSQPVKGAHVGFGQDRVASNSIPSFETKDDGKFSFAFRSGTSVVLTAIAKGNAPELVKVVANEKTNDVIIKMQPAHAMEGHVLDPSGKPVANAYVWLDTWRECRTLGDKTLRTDQNGYFKWADAPVDTVYADVQTDGFMRSSHVPLSAGAVNEVRLTQSLQVTGTVTDAVTAKPIPTFKLLHGINWGNGQPTYFGTIGMQKLQGGTFSYTESWPRPGYALRAEADGYLSAESRLFKADEHILHFDLKLSPASGWKPTVMLPNGSPAAGAKAVLQLPGRSFQFNGDFDDPYDHDNEHFVAASDGSLNLPAQVGQARVYIFSDAGFATADQQAMKQNAKIILQPWGHIHGKLLIGKTIGAQQKIAVYSREMDGKNYDPQHPPLVLMLNMYTKTDAQGDFALDRVPPGIVGVGRYVERGSGRYYTGQYASAQKLDLQPGQSQQVQLGGNGRTVTGKLELPAELASQSDLVITGSMRSHFEMKRPPLPDDVKSMGMDDRKKWYLEWTKGDEGKAFQAAQTKAIAEIHDCPVEVKSDNSFVVEDAPPGTYDLYFNIASGPMNFGPGLASAATKLDVPASTSDQPIVAPTLKLEIIRQLKEGEAVPTLSAKTLEGKDVTLSDFRGKYVLLDFWATWCGPCVAETPNLKATWTAAQKDHRFAMISLSLDEQSKDAADYVKKNNLDWIQTFLPGAWESPVVKAYNVRDIPTILLIGPDGKLLKKDLRGEEILSAVNKALKQ